MLSRAISNGTDIQSKWLRQIVEHYPKYSEGWLLTGQGSMFKTGDIDIRGKITGNHNVGNVGNVGGHIINVASSGNAEQNRMIAEYEELCTKQKKQIEKLHTQEAELKTKTTYLEREIESLKALVDSKNELIDMYKKSLKGK